jgi:peptide/nickel transport system substrate-binding protein
MMTRSTSRQADMTTLRLLLFALGLLLSSDALAGKRSNTLEFAFQRETDFVDRIHTDSRESATLSAAIYDTLLYQDPASGQVTGLLARSWSWVDERTIDLDLREGVRFHNGDAFDADDVVYTVSFVIDPENKLRQQESSFLFVKAVEKRGTHKVRLTLNRAEPVAEFQLAARFIVWPARYTRAQSHMIHATRPIGTGPYRAREVAAGKGITLTSFEGYFDGPKPKARIPTVNIRIIPDLQTQVAELMAGSLDFAQDIPPDQAENLRANPTLKVLYGDTIRITFLSFDAAQRAGESALKDERVRRAIAHAIDRDAIAGRLIGGGSKALLAQCHPAMNHCAQDLPRAAYDPAKARELLAAAGQSGLTLNFAAAVDLKTVAEAIQGYLTQVGIRTRIETAPLPTWRTSFLNGRSQMSVLSWGGGGIYDTSAALPVFFDMGNADYARDAEVAGWIKQASSIMDQPRRAQLFRQALARIAEKTYPVPLYTNTANYVMTSEVDYTTTRVDLPILSQIGWK